jgi:bis(5'-nucleosyl)-tetraphosphatase (symmetrical)
MNKTYVIGDVHGCLDELKGLLVDVHHKIGERVILVGDLLDRGPDPVGVVRFARQEGFTVLKGNHEEKHERFHRHEVKRQLDASYKNPMRFDSKRIAEHEALTDEEHAWISALPVFMRFPHGGMNWIITHAGIPTNRPIDDQNPKQLVRVRWVRESDGAHVGADHTTIPEELPGLQPPGTVYWTQKWKGPESVIYGHMVHSDFQIRMDKVTDADVWMFGIDTGCCFGGSLTAATFWEDGDPLPSFISRPAKRAYVQRLRINASD